MKKVILVVEVVDNLYRWFPVIVAVVVAIAMNLFVYFMGKGVRQ